MAERAPAGIDLAAGRLADGLAAGPGLTDDDAERPGGALGEAGCAANSLIAGPPAVGEADSDPGDGSPSADALDWPLDVASERPRDGDGSVLSACADDLLAGDPASAAAWAFVALSAKPSRHMALTVTPTTSFRGILGRSPYVPIGHQSGATGVQPSLSQC
jgi:hypothetical protein